MSEDNYVRASVYNVEQNIEKYNLRLLTRFKTLRMSDYHPETDNLPYLKSEGVTQYQEMIG